MSLKSFNDISRIRSRVRRGGLASMSSGLRSAGLAPLHGLLRGPAGSGGFIFEIAGDYKPAVLLPNLSFGIFMDSSPAQRSLCRKRAADGAPGFNASARSSAARAARG